MHINNYKRFRDRVRMVLAVDHNGRAGNFFFLSIFDQHEEILTCPWLHYVHSYAITGLGEGKTDSKTAHAYWTQESYFRLIYNDINEQTQAQIIKFGGDPSATIDRSEVRRVFDNLISTTEEVLPEDLIIASYYAYAIGVGRDVEQIKYILVSDAISLRTESWSQGFSGRVVNYVIRTYRDPIVVQLIRDPRAALASSNHQWVNSLGNMYGIHWGNYWNRLKRLMKLDFDFDSVFSFGCWIVYFRIGYNSIESLKSRFSNYFIVVRNEDLNLNFVETMEVLCKKLDIKYLDEWQTPVSYVPTMVGKSWTGGGAYNSANQTNQTGPLENDSDLVAKSISGPNEYVTRRWRTRMAANEIFLCEWFLEQEFQKYGYEFLYHNPENRSKSRLLKNLFTPLRGELPKAEWVFMGAKSGGVAEFLDRLFFSATFIPFYILSRVAILRLLKKGAALEKQELSRSNPL